jgi:hypothetical protein
VGPNPVPAWEALPPATEALKVPPFPFPCPSPTLFIAADAILATTSQYSGRWSERQRAGKYGEKNLTARALQVEEMGAVTVGACRERFHPVPPGKSSCREPMQSVLRML